MSPPPTPNIACRRVTSMGPPYDPILPWFSEPMARWLRHIKGGQAQKGDQSHSRPQGRASEGDSRWGIGLNENSTVFGYFGPSPVRPLPPISVSPRFRVITAPPKDKQHAEDHDF